MRNFTIILLSIISFQALSQGGVSHSAGNLTTTQSFIPWWNLENGTVAGQFVETELCPESPSDTLIFNDFEFDIPSNATILGITVNIRKSASDPNEVLDLNVSLVNNGIISNNKADTTYWSTNLSFTDYGGTNDLWGTSLTPSIINSSSFGVSLQTQASASTCVNAWVDYTTILVTYSIPFDCNYDLEIQEEQQCSNFFMFNSFTPPFEEAVIEGSWYFGDGETIEAGYSMEHWYETPGTYDGYVEFSSAGCPDTIIEFTIEALECNNCIDYLNIAETDNCGEFIFDVAFSQANVNTNWYFGDGFYEESIGNVSHIYQEPGTYDGYVFYLSDECGGMQIPFTVVVEECSEGCELDVTWEEITCEYYQFFAETNSPNTTVVWLYDDEYFGEGSMIGIPFPTVGIHTVCAVYETQNCPEGVESCFEFDIDYTDCCQSNPVSLEWSVAEFGADQSFAISIFEVGEDINSLEYIDSGECFASDFSFCEFDYCLEDGCYAIYFSSASEFDIFDFYLNLSNNGNPIEYAISGVSPTVGFYAYFSIGDVSCPFEENCILDFGYETLPNGTYVFSAFTNSTSEVVWDFGDGATGTGFQVDHVYDTPGEYEVCIAFANDSLCSNPPTCGTIIVEDNEECTVVTITIEHDINDDVFEDLDISLLFPNLELGNQTITLLGQLGSFTVDYCLPDGCYELEVSPVVSVNDLSYLTITVESGGVVIGEGIYNEEINSVGLNFGINDDCTNNINENEIGEITVYPNPVQNELMVQIENQSSSLQYSLINVLGQTVKTGQLNNTNNRIQVNTLSEGQYQLVISYDNSFQTRTISITR